MLNQITKKVVYPAYWRYRKIRVDNEINWYFHSQWISREELFEIEWRKLKKLLSHAFENVPFYSERMKEAGCIPNDISSMDDFTKLPYLTKDDIINNQDSLLARNFPRETLVSDSTGGSTGRNISFYEDKDELSHRFATTIRTDSWANLNLGDKYAQIWGSPIDSGKAAPFRRWIDKLLLRRLFISSFNLSDSDLGRAVEHIQRFKPKVLIGYPTPLHRFAQFIAENNVGTLGIQSVISSAETLFDFQRQEIEEKLDCKVFNRYGCREFGVIAAECEYHKGLHIQSDRLLVEFIDNGKEEKEMHEIVVTDLHKYSMPFIRYRIGDLGLATDETCPCGRGFPLIKRIAGRTFDMIIGTSGHFVSGTFWTLLFRTVPGITTFQVYQPDRTSLKIQLQVNDMFDGKSLDRLRARVRERCGAGMDTDFKVVPEITPGPSGKHRFVISDISQDYFSQ